MAFKSLLFKEIVQSTLHFTTKHIICIYETKKGVKDFPSTPPPKWLCDFEIEKCHACYCVWQWNMNSNVNDFYSTVTFYNVTGLSTPCYNFIFICLCDLLDFSFMVIKAIWQHKRSEWEGNEGKWEPWRVNEKKVNNKDVIRLIYTNLNWWIENETNSF